MENALKEILPTHRPVSLGVVRQPQHLQTRAVHIRVRAYVGIPRDAPVQQQIHQVQRVPAPVPVLQVTGVEIDRDDAITAQAGECGAEHLDYCGLADAPFEIQDGDRECRAHRGPDLLAQRRFMHRFLARTEADTGIAGNEFSPVAARKIVGTPVSDAVQCQPARSPLAHGRPRDLGRRSCCRGGRPPVNLVDRGGSGPMAEV